MLDELPDGHAEKLQTIYDALVSGEMPRSKHRNNPFKFPFLCCDLVSEVLHKVCGYELVEGVRSIENSKKHIDYVVSTLRLHPIHARIVAEHYQSIIRGALISHTVSRDPQSGLFVSLTERQFRGGASGVQVVNTPQKFHMMNCQKVSPEPDESADLALQYCEENGLLD